MRRTTEPLGLENIPGPPAFPLPSMGWRSFQQLRVLGPCPTSLQGRWEVTLMSSSWREPGKELCAPGDTERVAQCRAGNPPSWFRDPKVETSLHPEPNWGMSKAREDQRALLPSGLWSSRIRTGHNSMNYEFSPPGTAFPVPWEVPVPCWVWITHPWLPPLAHFPFSFAAFPTYSKGHTAGNTGWHLGVSFPGGRQ